MPRRRKPLPRGAASAFAVGRNGAPGISRGRARGDDLISPFRGVRVTEQPRTQAQWCAAYLPRLRPGQFFSDLSAAVLWGMPLSRKFEVSAQVHVGSLAPARPPRARGVEGHILPAASEIRVTAGMPVLSPADTWSRLGTLLTHRELVVAGDYLVRKKHALCTLAQLIEAAAQNRRGIRAVRRALAEVREKTESPKETELRLMIVAAGLPEPLVGYTVRDAKGDFWATPDLAYVEKRIAIEYEGKHHFTDPDVYADDILRYELLEEAGWLVIRIIAADLGRRREHALTRIKRALMARA